MTWKWTSILAEVMGTLGVLEGAGAGAGARLPRRLSLRPRSVNLPGATDLPAVRQSRYVSHAAPGRNTHTFAQICRRTTAMKSMLRCLSLALALALPAADASAKEYEVVTRPNLEFVQHDGARLTGDLYLPKGLD